VRAEIIAVGSELLTPEHADTNSLLITAGLNAAGFEVRLKSIVGDREADLAALVESALRRSRLVIICGGLGPTEDDVTRGAVARALGRSVSVSPPVLADLRAKFARRGSAMAAINERQAEVIEGAEVLDNAIGTAPGLWLEQDGVHFALLPGPPRELRPMLEEQVLPRVRELGLGRQLARKSFRVAGLTESEVDSRIAPIYRQYAEIQTTILAARGYIGIRLHQWLEAGSMAGAIEHLSARIREELGSAIFTTEDEAMEAVVGRLLRERGLTLAVAESCTAGMIGSSITRIPGSSDYFVGGILCYSNDVKRRLCSVPEELLRRPGAVSAEAAEALACGVRRRLGSDVGLSATGIAGPGGGSADKPVGLVYFGFADSSHSLHLRRVFGGDRQTVRERSTSTALTFLRQQLITGGGGNYK
jgi:nicotinamide-nucleotide amidase